MNCPFCNKNIGTDDIETKTINVIKNIINKNYPHIFVCDDCRCMYSVEDKKIIQTTIMISNGDLEYFIILRHCDNITIVQGPKYPEMDRKLNETAPCHTSVWSPLVKFSYIMDVTPANALAKLKTILSFS